MYIFLGLVFLVIMFSTVHVSNWAHRKTHEERGLEILHFLLIVFTSLIWWGCLSGLYYWVVPNI